MEQTTSNNLVISLSSEFQEPTESSLFLMDLFSFPFILSAGALKLNSTLRHLRKLTLYYYYYYY